MHELISIGGRDSCCMILNEMLLERGVLRIPARRYENIPLRLSVLILMQMVQDCNCKGITEFLDAFNIQTVVSLYLAWTEMCFRH